MTDSVCGKIPSFLFFTISEYFELPAIFIFSLMLLQNYFIPLPEAVAEYCSAVREVFGLVNGQDNA